MTEQRRFLSIRINLCQSNPGPGTLILVVRTVPLRIRRRCCQTGAESGNLAISLKGRRLRSVFHHCRVSSPVCNSYELRSCTNRFMTLQWFRTCSDIATDRVIVSDKLVNCDLAYQGAHTLRSAVMTRLTPTETPSRLALSTGWYLSETDYHGSRWSG